MTAIFNFLTSFKVWILAKIFAVLAWIFDFVSWLIDYLEFFIFQIIQSLLVAGADIISSIPRPSVFTEVEGAFCTHFSDLGAIASGLDIGTPMALVMSAYVVRFGIRRLPFFG